MTCGQQQNGVTTAGTTKTAATARSYQTRTAAAFEPASIGTEAFYAGNSVMQWPPPRPANQDAACGKTEADRQAPRGS
jgi:hypothetical protein